jgi:hypothetical protein
MKIKQLLREGYAAFEVPERARNELARLFPPKFPQFIGHHITSVFGVKRDDKLPLPLGYKVAVRVVGYAVEDGLEALVVTVNNATHREDGKRYHITWSLDRSKGKKPVDSNDLIARGFDLVKVPFTFETDLQYFD